MKKITTLASVLGAVLFMSCGTAKRAAVSEPLTMNTERDTLAYVYGALEFGPHIAYLDSVEHLNVELIFTSIRDVLAGQEKMTREEADSWIREYYMVRVPARNLKEAEAFLAEVERRPGVVKTESGLLYEILAEGGSKKATNDDDTVVTLYTGTRPDGTVFDSTADRGNEPAEFQLNGVIPAWTEGMKLVGEGGRIRLYIHPNLAYGEKGHQKIDPNQALVFEIELLEVKPHTGE
jgi:FKBP-type peptidyl-prolyl cis-trans isomerase FkpA